MRNPGLGPYLKELRDSMGLSRKEVARISGIKPDTLGKIEQGALPLSFANFGAIADALRIPARHRIELTRRAWPQLFADAGQDTLPAEILPADQAQLELMEMPAAVFDGSSWDVIALNGHARRLAPGLDAGMNGVVWLFNDPVARRVMVNWHRNTHMAVSYLLDNAPEWENADTFAAIAAACEHDPQWSAMLTNPVAPPRSAAETISMRDPSTGVVTDYHQRYYRPEAATRLHWRLGILTPAVTDETPPTSGEGRS
ncbi:helix-turn-helix domain-containing protein [Nocardia sp. FBN12]|uniref:helix-turn-helix domain-containing protein n=1 Tax=Nocardia sp. FBN12 TaxID=3419766 RepID=UPI003D01C054